MLYQEMVMINDWLCLQKANFEALADGLDLGTSMSQQDLLMLVMLLHCCSAVFHTIRTPYFIGLEAFKSCHATLTKLA